MKDSIVNNPESDFISDSSCDGDTSNIKAEMEYYRKEENALLLKPLKILAIFTALIGLFALVFEVRYFSEYSLQIFFFRFIAIAVAFWVLIIPSVWTKMRFYSILVHTLLLSIIVSFGVIVYFIPETFIVNSQLAALVIFTSAVFLSWDVRNQIVVAIYYNLIFASSILSTNESVYFLPNLFESILFVMFISVMSIVACALNYRLRKESIIKSFRILTSEQKFKQIFENSAEGIFQLNSDRKIITSNSTLKKMLGYSKESALHSIDVSEELFTDSGQFTEMLKLAQKNMKVMNYRADLYRKDKEIINCSINLSAVKTNNGDVLFFQGSIRDITQSIKMEEERRKAIEQAEKANNTKTQFFAQMSHEIRTPIHVMLSFTSLLKGELQDVLDEDIISSFGIIDNAGRRITRTIDMILNMAELQTGSYEFNPTEIDVYKLIQRDLEAQFKKMASEKGLIFNVTLNAEDTTIWGDEFSICQIFDNLINNAIKYTEKGHVTLFLEKNREDRLVAKIVDSGIGISPEFIPNLFEAFSQEEEGYTRSFEGNGLGLALVKRYCEMNKADISVDSRKGEGTAFTIIFNS